MADKYNANIQRVRELMGHAGRQHEVLLSKSLFGLLGCVLRSIHGCPESALLANSNMAVLDDVCTGKFVALSRILQNVLCNIYAEICRSTPGYAVRNAMSSLLAICAGNNKNTSATGRECCTSVIGHVLQKRGNDCASMLTEVVSVLTKQIKNHETCRLASFKALALIVQGCGQKIPDLHGELIKTAAKYASDKSADVRLAIALLLTALAESSAATKLPPQQQPNSSADTVLATELLSVLLKNIEDPEEMVQSTYAAGLARLLEAQMKAHATAIEALKVDQNRGGAEETKKKVAQPSGASSKLSSKLSTAFSAVSSSSSSLNRKMLEEYSLPSILSFFSKKITSKSSQREGLLAAMTYFFANVSCDLSDTEVKSLLIVSLQLLQEPSFLTFPYDHQIFFRSRVSLLIRSGITSTLGEARKCCFVSVLLSCIAEDGEPIEFLMQRNEHQVLVTLNEVALCVRLLQDASIGVCDEVKVAALGFLSHGSFGVRTAAANVLNAIACHVEGLAAQILQQAITDARSQVAALLSERADNVAVDCNLKAARLSTMYRFHGQTLLISTLLRSADRNSLVMFPRSLVVETLSFGLDLLREDLLQAVLLNRSTVCSIIRAGSLIVSSCMNVGYEVVKEKVPDILVACDAILKGTLDTSALSGSRKAESKVNVDATSGDTISTDKSSQEDNMLYELMTVEAALVCLSSLLWLCPEALTQEDHGLALVVSGLEVAFRAVKIKYQPRFRSHFRFRTLHAILLECFSWLPRGVFPNCCQQVFIEALRVFRDSISSGFECTNLNDHVHPHQSILDSSASNSILSVGCDVPCMLRLEKIYSCLQKKESEASLTCIGNNGRRAARGLGFYIPASPLQLGDFDLHLNHASEIERGPAPVIEIDARTINAAIGLLSTTFVKQTPDYQSKTCILCAQAIEQFSVKIAKESSYSSISTSLFGSDDERRKKETLAYNATKNVVCAFNAIIATFPTHNGATLDLDLNWGQLVVDTLFDLTTSGFCNIRNAACNGLASFASKLPSSGLIETLTERTSTSLSLALDRRENGLGPSDLSGYLVLLTELFRLSPTRPDTRSHIVATIFNCIRKVDVSVAFRAHAFYALGVIFEDVASLVGRNAEPASGLEKAAFRAFLDKIWHSIDVHAVSIQTPGEEGADLLFVALLRLVSVATPLTLKNIPSSAFVDHLLLTFDAMKCAAPSPSPPLQEQALIMLQHFPSEKRLGAVLHVLVDVLVKHTYSSSTLSVELMASNLSAPVISFSNASLKKALILVEALIRSHPQECIAAGLDIVLFHVLHWASSHPSLYIDLPSLEHRRREPPVDIVSIILQLVNTFANKDCEKDPDHRTGRWLLTLRSLSIGVSLVDDSGTVDSSAETGGADGASSSAKATDENSINHLQLLSHFKDEAAARIITICAKIRRIGTVGTALTSNANAQVIFGTSNNETLTPHSGLLIPSSAVKIAAISLLADLLSTCCSIEGANVAHTDISLARKVTDEYLTSKEASQSSAPLFISLLLPELVTMAATCATFSINDKVMPSLHLESLRALEALVSRFGLSSDPDILKAIGDEDASGSALSQFVPQFLSAIRPGLHSQSVGLRFACCRLLCRMLEAGLLIDEVAVRRMVGGVVAAVVTRADTGLRAALRADCNETASTIDFYVTHVILAKIYLKANSSICVHLRSQLEPVLPSLSPVWHGMCVDAARFLQQREQKLDEKEPPSPFIPWPRETSSTSGVRGGLTYPPSAADSNDVQKCILFAFPFVLASAASTADWKTHPELFCLACGLLDHISITGEKSRETKTLALRALDALSSRDVSSGETHISSQQWATLVRHLSTRAQDDEKESLQVFVSLLRNLATRFDDGQEILSEEDAGDQSLDEELLRASLISLHLILPTIFEGFDKEAVMAGNRPTISFVVGEAKPFDVEILRILIDLSEALFGVIRRDEVDNSDGKRDLTMVSRVLGRLLSIAAVSGTGAASPLLQDITDKLIEIGSRPEISMPLLLVGEIMALREIASDLACYSATSSLLGVIARVLGDTSVLELFAPLLSELLWAAKLSVLSRAFLQCMVRFASNEDSANQELGNKLLSAALPSVLSLLQGDTSLENLNDDNSLMLLQVLFTVYKAAIVKEAFLSTALPTICSFLLSVESGGGIDTSAKSYSFLCQALTQMAVTHPQELKEQVIYLSTLQRASLQKCLRSASESGASQQTPGTTAPGPVGRIDVSRFKKV